MPIVQERTNYMFILAKIERHRTQNANCAVCFTAPTTDQEAVWGRKVVTAAECMTERGATLRAVRCMLT